MLSGAGVDYTLMGGAWSSPTRITYSFVPDGVYWDRAPSDLNARMDASFGSKAWQDVIARSLQTWAAVANINFTQVQDGNYEFNVQGLSQGDSRFGDIRIGGYAFEETTMLARTYGPPPNGSTAAGDAEINTSFNFGAGAAYDLGTVALHELGHSLGLSESPQPDSVMYAYYSGVRQSLSPYDIRGIQALYGPRLPDAYRATGLGGSASSAIDLTTKLNGGRRATVHGLNLTAIGDTSYFSVQAPNAAHTTFEVTAAASGISLLSPRVTVYDAAGREIATDAQASSYGNNVHVVIPNAVPGQQYTIAVQGATSDVFSVGAYALAVAFEGGDPPPSTALPPSVPIGPPTPPPPPTATPTPIVTTIPADRFEPNNSFANAADLGGSGQAIVTGLTLHSGTDADVFTFTASQAGIFQVSSSDTLIIVSDASGRQVAAGTGLIGFSATQAGARYYVTLASPNGSPVANYGFSISQTPTTPVVVAPSPTPTPESPPVKQTPRAKAAAKAAKKAAQRAAQKAAQAARKAAQLAAVRARAARRAIRALAVAQARKAMHG